MAAGAGTESSADVLPQAAPAARRVSGIADGEAERRPDRVRGARLVRHLRTRRTTAR